MNIYSGYNFDNNLKQLFYKGYKGYTTNEEYNGYEVFSAWTDDEIIDKYTPTQINNIITYILTNLAHPIIENTFDFVTSWSTYQTMLDDFKDAIIEELNYDSTNIPTQTELKTIIAEQFIQKFTHCTEKTINDTTSDKNLLKYIPGIYNQGFTYGFDICVRYNNSIFIIKCSGYINYVNTLLPSRFNWNISVRVSTFGTIIPTKQVIDTLI